jgi:hypothetical protein
MLTILCCFILPGCSDNQNTAAKSTEYKKEFIAAGEKVELKKVDLIDNKLEVAIPATFNKMTEDVLQKKYPSAKPPQLAYTNAKTTINIAFSETPNAVKDEQIPEAKESLKNAVKANAEEWCDDGVAKVNGKNVAYMEFVNNAADGKIYNRMMLMEADSKLVIISFNCLEKDKPDWQPIAKEIMNSIKVK